MQKNLRNFLLASTAFSLLFAATPSYAADQTTDAIKALQAQVAALQKQLNTLQSEQKTQEQAQTATEEDVAKVKVDEEETKNKVAAKEILPGVRFTPGGYAEADGVFRAKNEATDSTSGWNAAIPFANSPNSSQSEFRGTARATRATLKAEGKPDDNTMLTGYVETDFLGSGVTSNSTQTNSYDPRLRQAFAMVDRNDLGVHVLAGQAWSLVSPMKQGLDPFQIANPIGIDSGYLPGFNFTRQAQIRVVKDFDDNKINVGLSAENPQVNLGGITAPSSLLSYSSTGVSPLNTGVQYSTDIAPDMIAKLAYDPGFGHYEVFGMTRFFHDKLVSNFNNEDAVAFSGGASAYLPVIAKALDVQGTFMGGQGIGRYSAGQLPDLAFKPNGEITPTTELTAMLGVIGHPTPAWDTYVYAGAEKVMRDNENSAAGTYGYGNFAMNNSGCYVINGTCTAQTALLWQVTPGVWDRVYSGNYGTLSVGAQYSLTRRNAFTGANNLDPHSYENIVMTAFRYSPF